MELACGDLFRAKWTDRIHEEWIGNLLKKRPDLDIEKIKKTRALMNSAVMDCLVDDYDDLIDPLVLPDPDDRHVLAAAIKCGADAVVTFNTKDFPADAVSKYDIEILHPDDFLHAQFGLSEATVLTAMQHIRRRLTRPKIAALEYLQILERQGLPKIVGAVTPFASIL